MMPYGGGYGEEMLTGFLVGEDESEGLKPIPEGTYPVRVADVEPKQTSKGGYMWAVTLEVADGPLQGRKLFYNANWTDENGAPSGGIGFTQMFLKACGVEHTSGQPGVNRQAQWGKSAFVGKLVLAVVTIQKGGQYDGRNQVSRIEPMNQQGAPAGVMAGPAGPGQWQQPGAPSAQPTYAPPAQPQAFPQQQPAYAPPQQQPAPQAGWTGGAPTAPMGAPPVAGMF